MKITLIVIGIIAVIFIVFQIYISMETRKTETQLYKVITKENTYHWI